MQTNDIKASHDWIDCYLMDPEPNIVVIATYDFKSEFEAMICNGFWFQKTEKIGTPLAWRKAS